MQLKKINQDHYVVVTDEPITEGDYHFDFEKNEIDIWKGNLHSNRLKCKKITHSTQPLNKSLFFTDRVWGCERLSLGEVKELIGEVDVENKAEEKYPKSEFWVGSNPSRLYNENAKERRCFIEGYNQALEDNKEKKYTEEDLADAINMARNEPDMSGNAIIQSLQPQTEWEVEFINGQLKLK